MLPGSGLNCTLDSGVFKAVGSRGWQKERERRKKAQMSVLSVTALAVTVLALWEELGLRPARLATLLVWE